MSKAIEMPGPTPPVGLDGRTVGLTSAKGLAAGTWASTTSLVTVLNVRTLASALIPGTSALFAPAVTLTEK